LVSQKEEVPLGLEDWKFLRQLSNWGLGRKGRKEGKGRKGWV